MSLADQVRRLGPQSAHKKLSGRRVDQIVQKPRHFPAVSARGSHQGTHAIIFTAGLSRLCRFRPLCPGGVSTRLRKNHIISRRFPREGPIKALMPSFSPPASVVYVLFVPYVRAACRPDCAKTTSFPGGFRARVPSRHSCHHFHCRPQSFMSFSSLMSLRYVQIWVATNGSQPALVSSFILHPSSFILSYPKPQTPNPRPSL